MIIWLSCMYEQTDMYKMDQKFPCTVGPFYLMFHQLPSSHWLFLLLLQSCLLHPTRQCIASIYYIFFEERRKKYRLSISERELELVEQLSVVWIFFSRRIDSRKPTELQNFFWRGNWIKLGWWSAHALHSNLRLLHGWFPAPQKDVKMRRKKGPLRSHRPWTKLYFRSNSQY